MRNKRAFYWFLFGLGGQLQVVASLSFTEIFVLIAAPCWIISEWPAMKRTGASVFLAWSLMALLGGVISYVVYGAPLYFAIRRFAVLIVVSCGIVVVHRLLRREMSAVGWYFLGGAISGVLSTYVFQKSVEVVSLAQGESGARASQDIMRGPLYWLHRIGSFVTVLYKGWYLRTPLLISISLPVGLAIFGITMSSSGRGPALGYLCASFLMLFGGKKIKTMRRVSQHISIFLIVGFCVIFAFHKGYGYLAREGALGEMTAKKYQGQTRRGAGMIDLLIGGRPEAIIPFYACLDRPILGFGFCPYDTNDYVRRFLDKYGSIEDALIYYKTKESDAKRGIVEELKFIPAHSHMGAYWLLFGILGLLFWVYIVFVIIRFLKYDAATIPQWYGWLVAGAPALFWDIMFNPFAGRIGVPLFVVACLLARAVRLGRLQVPVHMATEIRKYSL